MTTAYECMWTGQGLHVCAAGSSLVVSQGVEDKDERDAAQKQQATAAPATDDSAHHAVEHVIAYPSRLIYYLNKDSESAHHDLDTQAKNQAKDGQVRHHLGRSRSIAEVLGGLIARHVVRLWSLKCILQPGLNGHTFLNVILPHSVRQSKPCCCSKVIRSSCIQELERAEGSPSSSAPTGHYHLPASSASVICPCSEAAALFSFTGSPPCTSQFPGGGVRLHICSGPCAEQVSPPTPHPWHHKWMFRWKSRSDLCLFAIKLMWTVMWWLQALVTKNNCKWWPNIADVQEAVKGELKSNVTGL